MKIRKKRTSEAAGSVLGSPPKAKDPRVRSSSIQVRLRPVNTPSMVSVSEWPSDVDVRGCFVKLCPVVKREERTVTDWPAVVDELKERGAWAVMFAPKVVGVMDTRPKVEARRSMDARERLREWMGRNPMLSPGEDYDAVLDFLDGYLAKECL